MDIFDWVQVMFIGLKVTGKLDWSWKKVFIPFYLVIGIALIRAIAERI